MIKIFDVFNVFCVVIWCYFLIILNGLSLLVFVCLIVKCRIIIFNIVKMNLKIFFYLIILSGLMEQCFRIYFFSMNWVVVKICVFVMRRKLIRVRRVFDFFVLVLVLVFLLVFLFGYRILERLMMVMLRIMLMRDNYWKRWSFFFKNRMLKRLMKRISVLWVIWQMEVVISSSLMFMSVVLQILQIVGKVSMVIFLLCNVIIIGLLWLFLLLLILF